MKTTSVSVFLLITLVTTTISNADIYKWVNGNGTTVYSDEQPDDEHAVIAVDNRYTGVSLEVPPFPYSDSTAKPSLSAQPTLPESPANDRRTRLAVSNLDRCKHDRENCFSPDMDQICLLRWGETCNTIYFWSACEQKKCFASEESCNSPFRYLMNRPFSVNERDLQVSLKKIIQSTPSDWDCLRKSGLFCEELRDESQCQARYDQSCDSIKNWVETAKATCEARDHRDCLSFVQLVKHRPVTQQERARRGRGRYSAKRDPLRERYAFNHDEASDRERMEKVLSQLPLGDRNLNNYRLTCEYQLDPKLSYKHQQKTD